MSITIFQKNSSYFLHKNLVVIPKMQALFLYKKEGVKSTPLQNHIFAVF